jgi:nitric oxide dioxygenase
MTEREKQLIRESFAGIREVAGPLSLLFYGRLFAMEPGLRRMFQGDIAKQGMKLMEMLTAVVENLDQVETLTPVLQAMGQRHAGYGVLPEHYGMVERALLWSMGQALEAAFDAEVQGAWQGVIGAVSAAMQEGARG